MAPIARRLRCLMAVTLLLIPLALCAVDVEGAGIRPISFPDPVNQAQTPGFVFYPSSTPTHGTTAFGPYDVAATSDAAPTPGPWPLVIISHGHGGSDLGHHDLASYLARHGFVVATFEQPGDNFHDQSGSATSRVLVGRAIEVRAVIDTVLSDAHWKTLIDPARIGVAGFSAGGYTALLVVGAKPRFDLFIGYCHRHPDDMETCGPAKKLTPEAAAAYLADIQHDIGRWGDTADPRVKAAFVMAPLSLVFDKAGAGAIDRPVDLWYGQHDHVLLPSENALHLKPLVPTLARVNEVPKADHWVFLAPCSAALAKDAGAICKDPPGVDRAKVHQRINADAVAFFRKALGTR
ncbi:dienelactone hydrolase family protein [Frateuria edaphi]|uniref:alpha/beta hydrolase family protein n=1 Tax=Frateuria edaphi TaxID=2898793 RepID=UPI001E2AB5B9|nr:dienelactone hydrolase family protein [Frateuria edaphi]UGB44902.1 dienelactone hydrolase family protein [Frateuria edaphi]